MQGETRIAAKPQGGRRPPVGGFRVVDGPHRRPEVGGHLCLLACIGQQAKVKKLADVGIRLRVQGRSAGPRLPFDAYFAIADEALVLFVPEPQGE